MGYMTRSTRRRSPFNSTTGIRERASRLIGKNWLMNGIVLSYACIILASGVITVIMTLVIQFLSTFSTFDQPGATSEPLLRHHHGRAWQPVVPYGILMKHPKHGWGGQSLFRRYASQNCSIWAPRAEGPDHLIIHFGKLQTHTENSVSVG